MTYRVVKQQNWTIRGPDNQPAAGFLLTVTDDQGMDSFNIEVASLDAYQVQQAIQAHIDRRRAVSDLTFE